MVDEPAHLVGKARCKRCRSRDVRFRYYNNKNENQPRYYCYGCKKYYQERPGKVRKAKAVPAIRKPARRLRRRLGIDDSTRSDSDDSDYTVGAERPSQAPGLTSRTFPKITIIHLGDPNPREQRASEEHESGGPAEHSLERPPPAGSSVGVEIQQDADPRQVPGPVNVAAQGSTAEEVERNAECPQANDNATVVAVQNQCPNCELMSITEVEGVKLDDPADLVYRFRYQCARCGEVLDNPQVRWDPQGIPGVSVLRGDPLSRPPNPPPKTSPACPRCFKKRMAFGCLKKYSRQETRTQCEVCPKHMLELKLERPN